MVNISRIPGMKSSPGRIKVKGSGPLEQDGPLSVVAMKNEELKQSVQYMAQEVQSVQQMAEQAAQVRTHAQDYAQRTAQNASSVQSNLSNLAQQASTDVLPPKRDPDDTIELNPRRKPRT